MGELEGFVGSHLGSRGWLTRNVFGHFALLQVKCSFPFKIIHIAGDLLFWTIWNHTLSRSFILMTLVILIAI